MKVVINRKVFSRGEFISDHRFPDDILNDTEIRLLVPSSSIVQSRIKHRISIHYSKYMFRDQNDEIFVHENAKDRRQPLFSVVI